MDDKQQQAKKYNRVKIVLSLCELVFTIILVLVILISGLTSRVEGWVNGYVSNPYLVLLGFVFILGLAEKVIWLPVTFYSGYILEHKYDLSNQTVLRWAWDTLKGDLVGVVIMTPLLLLFYFFLRNFGSLWWLPVGTVFFLFSVVMAQLAPVLIMPLFYKFTDIDNEEIKASLIDMSRKIGFKISGVFKFNLSKDTKKANAALAGLGRTRRIIIADTLLGNFSEGEIQSVFAHELGHHVYKHIWKLIVVGAVTIFLGLFITSTLYAAALPVFGFEQITQVAALPLLTLFLILFGLVTMPLQNGYSRKLERQADHYALETKGAEAFITAMDKLADMNLGDREPHPVVEFMFYSHPAIGKRVKAAKDYSVGNLNQ